MIANMVARPWFATYFVTGSRVLYIYKDVTLYEDLVYP